MAPVHFHSQEKLYQNFRSAIKEGDQCMIHPAIKNLYLANMDFAPIDCKSIEKILVHWKHNVASDIFNILQKSTNHYFSKTVNKNILAQEILNLFLDIGFLPQNLEALKGPKKEALKYILNHLSLKIPELPIDSHRPVHIFGYSFDTTYLSLLTFVLGQSFDAHFWLVAHRGYSKHNLQQNENQYSSSSFFKPFNQFFYTSTLEIIDFCQTLCKKQQGEEKVGILVSNPVHQKWLFSQCALNNANVHLASSFEQSDFHVLIGSLHELALHSFDVFYVFDIWFEKNPSSILLDSYEAGALHAKGILAKEYYYQQELLSILSSQCQSMYFVFDRSQTIPFSFFHPDESADPLPQQVQTNTLNSPFYDQSLEKHLSCLESKTWEQGDVRFTPLPKNIRVSPTSLTQLARCPRQYFFRHTLEIPGIDLQEKPFSQSRKDYGIMIHEFLQNCFTDPEALSQNPSFVFAQEKKKVLDQFLDKIDPHYQSIWKKEMEVLFNRLYRYVVDQLRQDWKAQSVEYRIEDDGSYFNDLMDEQDKSISYHFKGQIDRIDIHQNNLRLIDYKTGSVKKKKTDLLEGGLFIQMPLYMHYLGTQQQRKTLSAQIHQISPSAVEIKAPISHEILHAHQEELKSIVKDLTLLIKNQHFIPEPGPADQHCRACSFVEICGPYLHQTLENKSM